MPASILIYGYGNPGRQDDGLGVALVAQLEQWSKRENYSQLAFDSNYQLNAEDALTISAYGVVIFVDATKVGVETFSFQPIKPHTTIAFSTHAMTPESVLALCTELYGKQPAAYLLAVRGYAWEPHAKFTPAAQANLAAAYEFITRWLTDLPV